MKRILFVIIAAMALGGCATANLGDISKLTFEPTRKIVASKEIVSKNADRVFELTSSVDELNKFNPFKFRISHLKGENNHDHAIFAENYTQHFIFNKDEISYWYTVEYDKENRCFSALLVDKGTLYGRYTVKVAQLDESRSEIKSSFIYTALNEEGATLLNNTPDSRILKLLETMNQSVRHYAETGKTDFKAEPLAPFVSKFYQTSATGMVIGSVEESFHMAGGLEELCWVPNWRFNLLWSDKANGRTGNNTVLEESGYAKYMYLRSDMPLYWHVVEYDETNHKFQVAMNFSGELLGRLSLKFEQAEGDNTLWHVEFTYASLTERGNELMEQGGILYLDFPEKIKVSPTGLIRYAQYHKKTGGVYKPSNWWLFRVGMSSILGTLFSPHFS